MDAGVADWSRRELEAVMSCLVHDLRDAGPRFTVAFEPATTTSRAACWIAVAMQPKGSTLGRVVARDARPANAVEAYARTSSAPGAAS